MAILFMGFCLSLWSCLSSLADLFLFCLLVDFVRCHLSFLGWSINDMVLLVVFIAGLTLLSSSFDEIKFLEML